MHWPWHPDQAPATLNERVSGYGLCTTIKYLRGAAGIGLGITIKYLRRTTSATANNGLHHYQVPREPKRRRGEQLGQGPHTQKLGMNSDDFPYSVAALAAFVSNSEPHTGARPSVRLYVGPKRARSLHIESPLLLLVDYPV
jgi:hypothetical protein